jgi:hypothetical protein
MGGVQRTMHRNNTFRYQRFAPTAKERAGNTHYRHDRVAA